MILGTVLVGLGLFAFMVGVRYYLAACRITHHNDVQLERMEGTALALKVKAEQVSAQLDQTMHVDKVARQRLKAAQAVEREIMDRMHGSQGEIDFREIMDFLNDQDDNGQT